MSRIPTVFRYRGPEGMLAWAFHRISGVGIFAFVVLHVIDIYLVGGNRLPFDVCDYPRIRMRRYRHHGANEYVSLDALRGRPQK